MRARGQLQLNSLSPALARTVCRSKQKRLGVEDETVDLVFELFVEISRCDRQAIAAEPLLEADLPALGSLRLQVRVADELGGEKSESLDERRRL